jgi:DNA polymerase III subunit gamma/tau
MSYQPLHHKYRPQTFAQLVGQEAIATTLTQALEQQRIPPAYLFTGARGTGKTSSARIMAKSLNCLQSDVPTANPCGKCEVCRAIVNGSALDVIEIDAASNTGVDNIRELIERAQFAPVQCRYKVYAIDECHMLSTAAFNALLKTLEEPPDRVVFILATTDPQRVLPTIISRCQRFDFRRIPLADMVQHLQAIARQEQIAIADDAITLIGQISQGGLRDAESLLDQLSLSATPVIAETVWELVGAVPERDLLALLEAIAANAPEAVLDHTRRLLDRGREPLIVLQNLASFYRDLLIAKTSPQRGDLVALTPPTWQKLCEFAQGFDLPAILWGQQQLRSSEAQLKHTTQPRLWLEVTLMGVLPVAIAPSPSTSLPVAQSRQTPAGPAMQSSRAPALPVSPPGSPREVPKTAPQVGSAFQPEAISDAAQLAPAPAPEVAAAPVGPPAVPPIETSPVEVPNPSLEANQPAAVPLDLAKTWQQVLANIEPPGTRALLGQHGSLQRFEGGEVQISIRSQPLFDLVKGRLPNVEAAFVKMFGQPVRVSLQVMADAVVPPVAERAPITESAPLPVEPSSQTSWPSAVTPPTVEPKAMTAFPEAMTERPEAMTELPEAMTELPEAGTAPPIASPDQPIAAWQTEDEGIKAAKSLAYAFNGEVVGLDDEVDEITPIAPIETALADTIATAPDDDTADEDEDEVDF